MLLYQQSDYSAFEVLFLRWKNRVWSYVSKKIKSTSNREDVLQKIYLKLHRSRALYDHKYLFSQWIFTIAKTSIYDELRSIHNRNKKNNEKDESVFFDEPQPEESSNRIEMDLSSLTKQQQEVLKLRLEDDCNFSEISKLINKSEVNSRKIFSRAIEKLKKISLKRVEL